jgi:hypothetical protein
MQEPTWITEQIVLAIHLAINTETQESIALWLSNNTIAK